MVNATTSGARVSERHPSLDGSYRLAKVGKRNVLFAALALTSPSQVQRHSQSRKHRCDLSCWPKTTLPRAFGAKLRVTAQLANTIVFYPRVTNLRALGGGVGPERASPLPLLGHCDLKSRRPNRVPQQPGIAHLRCLLR